MRVKPTDKAEMTTNKWLATRNFINLWLSDQTVYCNNCGSDFDANYFKYEPCCDNPQLGRNFDHMYGLFKQNKLRRETLKNIYGSTESQDLRVCISLPPRLLTALEGFFKTHGEKLFNDYDELMEFMKRFPEFRVPDKT
jgi:hypothetical protein